MRPTHLHLAHRPDGVALYQDGRAEDAATLDAYLFGLGATIETRETTALPFSAHGYREALTILVPGRWRLYTARGPHADVWVAEVTTAAGLVRGVAPFDWLAMALAVGEVQARDGA